MYERLISKREKITSSKPWLMCASSLSGVIFDKSSVERQMKTFLKDKTCAHLQKINESSFCKDDRVAWIVDQIKI